MPSLERVRSACNLARGRDVESKCGAVVLGSAYRCPAHSVAGASLASPWLRFHTPLIKPGVRFSRTGLSDKAVLIFFITRSPTNDRRYVRWSRCNPSSWYRCSAWNRFFP